jgi:hypothetical protein
LKKWFLILIPCFQLQAQTGTCILKEPGITINFGAGEAVDMNTGASYAYRRVLSECPTDGHYAYIPYTSDCFRGDWITLTEDHTPGDNGGNMLVVNSSYYSGHFFNTSVTGLKPGANYEFSVWMLNLCKPSDKCPFPLLPNITIQMRTPEGKFVLEMNTGDLKRYGRAQWTKFDMMFRMPRESTGLDIVMTNHSPGGCGNDFAMDDLSFKECIVTPPVITKKKNTSPPAKTGLSSVPTRAPAPTSKSTPPVKKSTTASPVKGSPQKPVTRTGGSVPPKKQNGIATVPSPNASTRSVDSVKKTVIKPGRATAFPPAPPAVANRSNPVVRKFETGAGVIRVDLFDNGQIDGDTVSIYHNNKLILSRVRLSEKAISFNITIDANNPHHELVMVANNLGSIPPNTSLMYVTAGSKKYEVFISSTETQNAKLVFDLAK